MGNVKRLTAAAATVLGLGVVGAAHAGVTSTWTVVNDYDFRGFSQSAKDPALQGSIDWAHDSGFYLGAWGSNVDFPVGDSSADLEIDLYGGFTKAIEGGVTWDVGLVQYAYDESDTNYLELYGSIAKDWFKGKLWFSPDFTGDVTDGDTEAWYIEGNGTFPLPQNFSIVAHAGYSFGDYWDAAGDEVIDYSLGLGYVWEKLNFALKYVDTESDIEVTDDVGNNEGRVLFSVATTLPWKD